MKNKNSTVSHDHEIKRQNYVIKVKIMGNNRFKGNYETRSHFFNHGLTVIYRDHVFRKYN